MGDDANMARVTFCTLADCARVYCVPSYPLFMPLDMFEGQCWIGIVPFHMTYVRPRWVPPATALSSFVELNVRTYVTLQGIPGVYFFSLDASNPIAVAIARTFFHLPYFNAAMSSERVDDTIHYYSRRTHQGAPPAEFKAIFRPIAPITFAQHGSLEHWLTERYCLYTVSARKRCVPR